MFFQRRDLCHIEYSSQASWGRMCHILSTCWWLFKNVKNPELSAIFPILCEAVKSQKSEINKSPKGEMANKCLSQDESPGLTSNLWSLYYIMRPLLLNLKDKHACNKRWVHTHWLKVELALSSGSHHYGQVGSFPPFSWVPKDNPWRRGVCLINCR